MQQLSPFTYNNGYDTIDYRISTQQNNYGVYVHQKVNKSWWEKIKDGIRNVWNGLLKAGREIGGLFIDFVVESIGQAIFQVPGFPIIYRIAKYIYKKISNVTFDRNCLDSTNKKLLIQPSEWNNYLDNNKQQIIQSNPLLTNFMPNPKPIQLQLYEPDKNIGRLYYNEWLREVGYYSNNVWHSRFPNKKIDITYGYIGRLPVRYLAPPDPTTDGKIYLAPDNSLFVLR